jgi:hypothetical protein
MRLPGRTVAQQLARLALGTHGVVARTELLAAGIPSDQIARLIRAGSLLREYRGVYRVGHRAPSIEAYYLAAVRACGEGSLLAGRAAAYLLGLLKCSAPQPEVVAPRDRRVPGVVVIRTRGELGVDGGMCRGVPVTSVARTLVDIAASLTIDELARACHEAGVRYRTTPRHVEAVLARRPSSRGAGRLRLVMKGDVKVTLSKLEKRFLELLRANGLPLPITNRVASGGRVDCRWPDHPLTVELDSYRYHGSRYAWERDRRRERVARAAGDEFRRYTYGDVFESPRLMLAELRRLLCAQVSDPAGA